MLVLDRSSSMGEPMIFRGEQHTRIDVVREIAGKFIQGDGEELKGRPEDLIGLVTFAGYADTVCPLVRIHDTLVEFVDQLALAQIRSEDGTAIGDGLALAAARLKQAEDELAERNEGTSDPDFEISSKVIVLMTDGQENGGDVSFRQASELCKELGVKLYAIGIGGGPYRDRFGRNRISRSPAEEPSFRANAELTGGIALSAQTGEDLLAIYEKIDELEKTEIESIEFTSYHEAFTPYAIWGLALVLADALAAWTLFRRAGA